MDNLFSLKRDPPKPGKDDVKLEVDRISFSSFNTDDIQNEYDTLYMSVEESPYESASDLSSDIQSLKINGDVFTSTPLGDHDESAPSELPCFPCNSDFPFWRNVQLNIHSLTDEDDCSPEVEKSNQMMYMAELVTSMVEEVRWRNEIGRNPELVSALAEVDPKFCSSLCQFQLPIYSRPNVPLDVDHTQSQIVENGTFYVNAKKKSVTSVRSSTEGVDEVVLKRDAELTPSNMAVTMLSVLAKREPIVDHNVSNWVSDVVAGKDKLLENCGWGGNNCDTDNADKSVTDVWIFHLHPQKNTRELLEEQGFRCADCGAKIEKEYMKRVRYCEYYGKVFCQCCHQGTKARIPARMLHLWSFKEFPVSDRALSFLSQAKDQSAIHIRKVAPKLVEKIRVLRSCIQLRQKLIHMWSYVERCPLAEETVTKHGNLRTMFASLERHLLEYADVFSLTDLERVHNGDMGTLLEPIVQYGKYHIEKCDTCRAQAFFCEGCANETDHLFAFQTERVARCEGCGSLSHLKCDARRRKLNQNCPKCARLEQARLRRKIISVCED